VSSYAGGMSATSTSDPRTTWVRFREALLFLGGIAWACAVDLKGLAGSPDPYPVIADFIVGLLMQWSGLLVWRRRGTGNLGPWLYLAGILWYVGSGMPWPIEWMTFPVRSWYEPLLVAVILTYPFGHLVRPIDRILVGTLIVAYLLRTVVRACFFDLASFYGNDAPPFPTLIRYDLALYQTVESLVIGVSAIVGVAVAVVCVARYLRATGPARRTLAPVLLSGLAIAPLLGWSALTTGADNTMGLPIPSGVWVEWLQILLRAFVPLAILVGIVRLQTARSSLADLLLELDRGVPVGQLQGVLRRQLHDPSVRLVFPRPGSGLVDADGEAVTLPTSDGADGITRIDDGRGHLIAYIVHDPALSEDPDLVRAAGAAARLSLDNERLQAEVRAQLNEVRDLSARLVEASDAERRRVERDLHDGAQQRLVTLALRLRTARDQASKPDADVVSMLEGASSELEEALDELRELARGIHPAILSRSGLSAAVIALAERSSVPVKVSVAPGRCAQASEATAYFVIAEALTNLARHASATGATVEAGCEGNVLRVRVVDDGVGGADLGRGSGLGGLRDRVIAIGGTLMVDSPVGRGTTVEAAIPCG
jgi:signal transduction histidine kinase